MEPTMKRKCTYVEIKTPKTLKKKKKQLWMTSIKPSSLLLLTWRGGEDTFFFVGSRNGMLLSVFLQSSLRIKKKIPIAPKMTDHVWKYNKSKCKLIKQGLTWFSDLCQSVRFCCLPSSSLLSFPLLFHQEFRLQNDPKNEENGSKHLLLL